MGLVQKGRKVPEAIKDICILDILGEACEEQPVTQRQIEQKLADDYGIEIDRKTLHRRLDYIAEAVGSVKFTTKTRVVNGVKSSMKTGFWLDRVDAFDESELRALIYTVIFSKHIPAAIKKSLVRNLEDLSSHDLRRKMRNYILEDEGTAGDYSSLFWNIEELSRAIDAGRQVSFRYKYYEADKELHDSERIYTVTPLGIGARGDAFYLVALINGVDNDQIANMIEHFEAVIEAMKSKQVRVDTFRLDRISDIKVLDSAGEKPGKRGSLRLKGAKDGKFDLQSYIRENPTLNPGHTVAAKLRVIEGERCTISNVIDHFGRANVRVSAEKQADPEGPRAYIVSLRVNDGALRDFVLRSTPCIEVLRPERLRKEMAAAYEEALRRLSLAH